MGTCHSSELQRSFHSYVPGSCGLVCQIREPEHSPPLTADSNSLDDELINDHVEPGFGIFDSGATGHAISVHELDQLRAEKPDAFTDIDETRSNVMGFGGGTRTFSLGVCTDNPSAGPMSHKPIEWDVSNNTQSNRPDRTPPLVPIAWARENTVVFDFDTGRSIFKYDLTTRLLSKILLAGQWSDWEEILLVTSTHVARMSADEDGEIP